MHRSRNRSSSRVKRPGCAVKVRSWWARETGSAYGRGSGRIRVVEAIETRVEDWRVAAAGCAGTPAVIEVGPIHAGLGRSVRRQGDVGLGCPTGKNVERRVNGDLEVTALRRIIDVGLGETHHDLQSCQ